MVRFHAINVSYKTLLLDRHCRYQDSTLLYICSSQNCNVPTVLHIVHCAQGCLVCLPCLSYCQYKNILKSALCSVQYNVYNWSCAVCSVDPEVFSTQCSVDHTVFCTQCSVQYTPVRLPLGFAPRIARFTFALRPSMIGFGSLQALSAASLLDIIT